ncbi:hypothetical protein PCA31118_04823 [Pandoraea captiosa]|uniref:Uncharacterized protein n=1 Tax=Pandoraea captiosa TaxID=2508302 RepID=A0A5E5ANX4_9BURK|nr:hypothetical protein PCA31118_04823 [Pandoraea captiosa]
MPRIASFTAGTAALIDPSPAFGPTARQLPAPPYATLAVAILAGRAQLSTGNAAGACTSSLANSPVPPASDGRPGELPTGKVGAGREPILRKGRPGSALNSWISWLATAKSLIIEKTCITSWGVFSTSHPVFSTSHILRDSPRFHTSLSLKLLKKKEKAEKKGIETGTYKHPRVGASFPRVGTCAYFLIHEFYPLPRVDSWKLVEIIFFIFRDLIFDGGPSTNPRVALRVVTPFAPKAGEQCS